MNPFLRRAFLVLLVAITSAFTFAQNSESAVRQWMLEQYADHGLTKSDATDWRITDQSTDKRGITYLYIRQEANGLPVHGAVANFALRNGEVINFGNRLQADVSGRVGSSSPGMHAADAVRSAARQLGLAATDVRVTERISHTEVVLGPSGISRDPIPAELVYQVVDEGAIPLAWDLVIRELGGEHWWHVAVDAQSGKILRQIDWIVSCTVPAGLGRPGYNAAVDLVQAAPPVPAAAAMPPPDGSGYRVFPFPTESPGHGPHILVNDPADPVASPHGWHDTDGMPGAEYTITRGNNVYAGEDWADTDVIGYSPDGGSGLIFDFPFTPPQDPDDYIDAAITNLFYTCNVLHDVWYHYGFDEESGNFQQTNYTGTGLGEDAVYAQAQDGSGTNNANFGTPEDGSPGAMQMYLWRTTEADSFIVNSPMAIAGDYTIEVGGFGPTLTSGGITADLVLVQDDTAPASDGCETIVNAAALFGKIAVVDRGSCTFVSKVLALEAAGAIAVIVVNNVGGAPITMGGTDPGGITIPSVMVSMANGQTIKNAMLNGVVNGTLRGVGTESLRDSDFDNGIIAHEYGHGVSNRLTGGPNNVDCLGNDEQMGEGWSDWMGMVLTMQAGDIPQTGRGVGTFVKAEGPDGPGIRPAPYSTDMAVNPYTYGITNTGGFQGVHARGFVWATMLWDLTWDLVDEEGFDPNMYTGTGGNNTAMRLVMDGLKLQPCEPGFVDGRDAILLADELNYGGVHSCLIWKAFARRGLGYSATQGSSLSSNDQVEAFDIPAACLSVGVQEVAQRPNSFIVAPGPGSAQMQLMLGSELGTDATVRLIGMDGRLLREVRMPRGSTTLTLDMSSLAHAAYIVELAAENTRPERKRFVYYITGW